MSLQAWGWHRGRRREKQCGQPHGVYPQTRDICLASRQGLGPGHAPWGGGANPDRLSLPAGTWHAAQPSPQLVPHQRVGVTEVDRARPAPGLSRSMHIAAGETGTWAYLSASHPGPRCCQALKLLPGLEGVQEGARAVWPARPRPPSSAGSSQHWAPSWPPEGQSGEPVASRAHKAVAGNACGPRPISPGRPEGHTL